MAESKYEDGFPDKVTKPSEGFFIAKRQIQFNLDHKVCQARAKVKELHDQGRIMDAGLASLEADFIEKLRDYVRNGMLWDSSRGS